MHSMALFGEMGVDFRLGISFELSSQ
jgi:hypothetical protein